MGAGTTYPVSRIPVIGFVAFSGTGKTTLLERIIPALKAQGVRLGVIKHAHHDFDIDIPGKDSYRLRKSGAIQTLVASAHRWALITEHETVDEPRLDELLAELDTDQLDLILVEGFKHEHFPKLEVRREALGKPLLYPNDPDIIALISDDPDRPSDGRPVFAIDNIASIVQFLCERIIPNEIATDGSSDRPARA